MSVTTTKRQPSSPSPTSSIPSSELNIEGAVVRGESLLLFQRGNGAPRAGLAPVNAVGSLDLSAFVRWLVGDAAPTLREIRQVDLGESSTVPFGFTDACLIPDGRVAFLAGAEDSPDTYRDGEVVGARFGILDADDVWMVEVRDERGQAIRQKLRALWLHEACGQSIRLCRHGTVERGRPHARC